MSGTASSPSQRSIPPASKSPTRPRWQAAGDGKAVWAPFSKDGRLADDHKSWVSDKEKLAGAIALRFTLRPGEKKIIPMVLAWDFPVVQFGEGRKWNRRYTDFYGTSGQNAWKIARDGLLHADRVERSDRPLASPLYQR